MHRKITHRTAFSIIVTVFSIADLSSQNPGSISGKIYDAKSKSILPGASVYLASTTIGVDANNEGSFLLQNIQPGKYDLIVSILGYKTYSKPVIVSVNSALEYDIYLEMQVNELKTVEITTKRANNRVYFDKFKQLFLGQTKNSSRCKILNTQDIFVFKEGTKLYVHARKPIEVENKALGYLIYFDLKEFTFDFFNNEVVMSVIPRFEELPPKSRREKNRWDFERNRAYYGSVEHFFRSLKSGALEKNHFKISGLRDQAIIGDSLLKDNHGTPYCVRGKYKVVYDDERPEYFYRYKTHNQESTLEFTSNKTELYGEWILRRRRRCFASGLFCLELQGGGYGAAGLSTTVG